MKKIVSSLLAFGLITSNIPMIQVDAATPAIKPITINQLTSGTGKITGKALPNNKVRATVFGNEIGEALADKSGKYSMNIPAQPEGIFIKVSQLPRQNIAKSKTASASSTWDTPYVASKAIDGDIKTKWIADSISITTPSSIVVDLGEQATTVDAVTVAEFGSNIQKFDIFCQVGEEWEKIYSGSTIGKSLTANFDSVTTSKIKLQINKTKAIPSINEIEVMSPTESDITTSTAKEVMVLASERAAKSSAIASSTFGAAYSVDHLIDNDSSTRWMAGANSRGEAVIEINLQKKSPVDAMSMEEDGHVIQKFDIFWWTGSAWEKAYGGTTAGKNFVASFIKPVSTTKLKLVIKEATGVSSISEIDALNSKKKFSRKIDINKLMELEVRKTFDYYWEQANTDRNSPGYGLVGNYPTNTNLVNVGTMGSVLDALVIGAERGYVTREAAEERAIGTLKTLLNNVPHEHGVFYGYANKTTAAREWASGAAPMDTSPVVVGAIVAGEYFGGEAKQLAYQIYDRIDWPFYYIAEKNGISFGYSPENGLERTYVWGAGVAEHEALFFLAAGSNTHPLNENMFKNMRPAMGSYKGIGPIAHSALGALFVYQVPHMMLDFRNKVDNRRIDWFDNSRLASLAHWQYSIDISNQIKTFNATSWGLGAGTGPNGYLAHDGAPPGGGTSEDGTVVLSAAMSSIPFTPKESMGAMKYYYETFPKLWGKYGFIGSYNLAQSDVAPWYGYYLPPLGKGMGLIMIENYRTGLIWKQISKSDALRRSIKELGLIAKTTVAEVKSATIKTSGGKTMLSFSKPSEKMTPSDYAFIYVYDANNIQIAGPIEMKQSTYSLDITNNQSASFKVVREKNAAASSGVMVNRPAPR